MAAALFIVMAAAEAATTRQVVHHHITPGAVILRVMEAVDALGSELVAGNLEALFNGVAANGFHREATGKGEVLHLT
jgi:hypothetical protein